MYGKHWVREEKLREEELGLAQALGRLGLVPMIVGGKPAYYGPALGAFLHPKDRCWACFETNPKTWPFCSKDCRDRFAEFSSTTVRLNVAASLDGAALSINLPGEAVFVLGALVTRYDFTLAEALRAIIAMGTQVLRSSLERETLRDTQGE
jgi:hypothetical protein